MSDFICSGGFLKTEFLISYALGGGGLLVKGGEVTENVSTAWRKRLFSSDICDGFTGF